MTPMTFNPLPITHYQLPNTRLVIGKARPCAAFRLANGKNLPIQPLEVGGRLILRSPQPSAPPGSQGPGVKSSFMAAH